MAEPNTPPAGAPPAGAPPAAPPPAGAAPPPAQPPAGAPPAGGEPFATFHTKEAFDERLDRSTRAKLRELGVDPEKAKKDAEELAAMKKADEERRAAEMSELEKVQAESEKLKTETATAKAEKEKAERAYEIARLGAAHQVPDLEYLAFRVRKCPDDQDRDEWLTKLLEDPVERARFGVPAAAGDPPADGKKPKATTTSTPAAGPGAPAPGGAGGAPGEGEKAAMKMTASEFADYKRKKYGGGGAGLRKGYKPPPR